MAFAVAAVFVALHLFSVIALHAFLDVDVGSHDICAVSLLSVSFGETA